MGRRLLLGILSIVAMLLVAACGGGQAASPTSEAIATPESTESSSLSPDTQVVANTLILYDSYADWCSTCRTNAPVIESLKEQFAGQIDIVRLNVDLTADTPTREKYGIYDRSQYVLVDAKGEVLKRWFGLLQEEAIAAELSAFVAAQG
jgi:thioredoxin 1